MTTRCLSALLVLLAGIPLAYAKGSPDLITISGGGLTQPIEITDSTSLKAFDPWSGQFCRLATEAARGGAVLFGVLLKFCST